MTDFGPVAAAYPSPPNHASPPHHKSSAASLYDRAAMSNSLSPNLGGASAQDKNALSTLNLGFLKNLSDKRTTRGMHAFPLRGAVDIGF